jgi:hypothetical protein
LASLFPLSSDFTLLHLYQRELSLLPKTVSFQNYFLSVLRTSFNN